MTGAGAGAGETVKAKYVAGIDEAGRGPVLGSMVYAIAWCPKAFETKLTSNGFADSKQLTPEKRDELMAFMRKHRKDRGEGEGGGCIDYAYQSLSAREISGKMLDVSRTSLNEIAFESTSNIIDQMLRKLGEEAKREGERERAGEGEGEKEREELEAWQLVDTVYVDTLGDPERHRQKLKARFPALTFVVESKADVNYPVVSAASIVAKTQRDSEVDKAMGSGYPGDPVTKDWLHENLEPVFGFPKSVRFSWSTVRKMFEDTGAVEVSWECEDEEEGEKSQQKLWNMTTSSAKKSSSSKRVEFSNGMGRHSFFRSRKLQKVSFA